MQDRTARPHHNAVPNGHTRGYKHIRGQPYALTNRDLLGIDIKGGFGVIMRAGTKITLLRDHCIRPNLDLPQGVQRHVIPNPGIIPNGQLPGIDHFRTWANQHFFANLCAKQTQPEPPPAIHELWGPG